jgi:molybdate transport system substrate-binding protein
MNHPTRGGRALASAPKGAARTTAQPHHTPEVAGGDPGRGASRHGAPRWRLPASVAALLLAVAVVASACGGSTAGAASGPRELNVFAAASLTDAFTQIGKGFTAAHPDVKVVLNFGGSNDLATQVQQGAPADVFASADTTNMDKVTSLVGAPQTFARNKLCIAVAPGNPKGITGLADLSRKDLKVVLAAPEVPAGKYADEILGKAGVTVHPVSLEVTVKGVVTKVALGEADAGIVYVTDVSAAKGEVDGVGIPDDQNVTAVYPIATVSAGKLPDDATAFVDYVLSADGQKVLTGDGFLPPQ